MVSFPRTCPSALLSSAFCTSDSGYVSVILGSMTPGFGVLDDLLQCCWI